MPTKTEQDYNRLTNYRFAQRYVEGKSVVHIGWEEVGYGTHMLAQTAEFVAGLANSPKALKSASSLYSAPNISYREANLPELPYPSDRFEVAVAIEVIENLEHPDNLVKEVKRVLKRDGVLIVSTPDKQTYSNDRNYRDANHRWEMYVPEFQELLERHFEHVYMYRQGTVACGLVFRASEEVTGTLVESAQFSSANPYFGVEPPTTHFIIAVCSDAKVFRQEEQPYLLLDRDRRILDECEDRAEDIELMRGEIQQMQETEVHAFQDTLEIYEGKNAYLRALNDHLGDRNYYLIDRNNFLRDQNENLKNRLEDLKNRLNDIENSRIWRFFVLYRQLRALISAPLKPAPKSEQRGDTHGPS